MLALLLAAALADTPVETLPVPLRATFEAAEVAWGEGRLEDAEQGFTEVIEAAPSFDRAWRRRCGVRLAREAVADAVSDCRQALTTERSVENRTAMAFALLHAGEELEAGKLVSEVIEERPDYLPAQVARCAWATARRQLAVLRDCVEVLEAASPGTPGTMYYRAMEQIEAGDLEGAKITLLHAQSKGLPDGMVAAAEQRTQERARKMRDRPRRAEARNEAWTLSDLAPLLVGAALVLTLAVLWMGRDGSEPPPGS